MAIQTKLIDYTHGELYLQGHMAWDETLGPRPAVLVAPTWAGRTGFESEQAKRLADIGYVGFALDMYGKGITGEGVEQCAALMDPVISDRGLLQSRMAAAVETVRAQPEVVDAPVAAIGFCFGGLCVLDLARSRDDVAGVVSFHGLLGAPTNLSGVGITAKVLVLHGYEDPMAAPDAMRSFCDEMTASGCDWQLHAYGRTLHAFTNPEANNAAMGAMFNEVSAHRAHVSMENFLAEVFAV